MDLSVIASASTSLHMGDALQSVAVSMLKKTMESVEVSSAQMIQSLQQAVPASRSEEHTSELQSH